jgi:hypothetical protein
MQAGQLSGKSRRTDAENIHNDTETEQVPIQVMVPPSVRRQLAIMSAERGESIRTVVLRALGEIGIKIPASQLIDRRGRRPGKTNGAR